MTNSLADWRDDLVTRLGTFLATVDVASHPARIKQKQLVDHATGSLAVRVAAQGLRGVGKIGREWVTVRMGIYVLAPSQTTTPADRQGLELLQRVVDFLERDPAPNAAFDTRIPERMRVRTFFSEVSASQSVWCARVYWHQALRLGPLAPDAPVLADFLRSNTAFGPSDALPAELVTVGTGT